MKTDELFLYVGEESIDPIVYYTYYLLCVEAKISGCNKLFSPVSNIKLILEP